MPKMRYFDYAATTPTDKRVLSAMLPYFSKDFGNPGSLYGLGRKAKLAVDKSSQTIAKILNCKLEEFIFTGSATEADNLAILGVTRAVEDLTPRFASPSPYQGESFRKGLKIITSQVEHKAVLKACEDLEKEGFQIVKLPVHKNGLVDLEALKKELGDPSAQAGETILVSITMADSETGTIQPISEIAKIIKEFKNKKSPPQPLPFARGGARGEVVPPFFHTDASQAAKFLDLDVKKLGVDMMTVSSHKIYGPKGMGGLFVRKGVQISPIVYGGGQQMGLRSGTENVPGIVGFAKAFEFVAKNRKTETVKIKKLRDALEKGILKSIPKVMLNGHPTNHLPNFLNISILDVEGEALLLHLDSLGIMVATGSACNSQSLEPSYILSALGNSYEYIHGSLRFSLGRWNTTDDVKYVLKKLPEIVKKLRAISPLNLKLQ